MLKLCGFPLSNYHNKVKLALLEKGVPFEEVIVPGGALEYSPLAKVPYILTEQGSLCESQAIVEYIEARWPEPPLLPADPWAVAKVRELNIFLDLHLELVVRQLYGPAFFGMPPLPEKFTERVRGQLDKSIAAFKRLARFAPYVAGEQFTLADCAAYTHLLPEMFTERVRGQLDKSIAAFKRLARFAPYVAGEQFTLADCAAYTHLPLVALATRKVYGADLLDAAGVDWKSYVKLIEQRPSAQK